MLRKRIILYLAFAAYQLTAFVFTILVDGHLDLLGLLRFIPLFKYATFGGVIFIAVDIYWFWKEHRDAKFHRDRLEDQNMHLKAKMYDYQEAAKQAETPKKSS